MKRDENLGLNKPSLDFVESRSEKEGKGSVLGRKIKGYIAGVGLSVLATLGVEPKNVEATPPSNVVMKSAADMYDVANYPNPQLRTFTSDGEPRFDASLGDAHVVEGVYSTGPAFVDANTGNVLNITGVDPFVQNLSSDLALPDRVAFVFAGYSGSIFKYYLVDFNTLTAVDVTSITGGRVVYICHASDTTAILGRGNDYFAYNFVNKSLVRLPSGSFDAVRNNVVSQYPSGQDVLSQSVTEHGAYLSFGSYANGVVVKYNPEIEQPVAVVPEVQGGVQNLNNNNPLITFSVVDMPANGVADLAVANLTVSGLQPQNGVVNYVLTEFDKQTLINAGNGEWSGDMVITLLDANGNVLKTHSLQTNLDVVDPTALNITVMGEGVTVDAQGVLVEVEKGVTSHVRSVGFQKNQLEMGNQNAVSVVNLRMSDFVGVDLGDPDAMKIQILSSMGNTVQLETLTDTDFDGNGNAVVDFTFTIGGNIIAAVTVDGAGNEAVSFRIAEVVEKNVPVEPVDMGSDMGTTNPDMENQPDMEPDMGTTNPDMENQPDMESDMGASNSDMGGKADMPTGENPIQPSNPDNVSGGSEEEGGCTVAGVEGGKPNNPEGIIAATVLLVGGVAARRKRKIPKSSKQK